ncbi:MAG TPA: STAS domain-containing protein [Blastococcus sp.]|nr:STAS domain-containing protein [Blastococcus sp.]
MTASSLDPSPGDLLSLTVSTAPAVVVTAVGEIDSTSAPELRTRLEELLDGEVAEFTVDLRQVSFLDSAGLCVLAGAHRRAVQQGARMRLLASSRAVIRPLQITGLWELLKAEQVDATIPLQQGIGAA